MVTRQVGPGMYQQYTTQECEDCQNVKLVRESVELTVSLEPGSAHGQVRHTLAVLTQLRIC